MSDEQIIFGTHHDSGLAIASQGFDPMRYSNTRLAREIMRLLTEFYPGYFWTVTADIEQGVATIAIPTLMGRFSYILHADKIANANDMVAAIKKGGGEILERFRLHRGRMNPAEYHDARSSNPIGRLVRDIPQ